MSGGASVPAPALRQADFAHQPVWRFLLEAEGEPGVDESHLVPDPGGLHLGAQASYLVAARFVLADGRPLAGAVQVDVLDRRVYCTPALLFAGGKALDPLAHDVATRLERITRQAASPPRRWALAVCFSGEARPRRGRIARWAWLRALGLLARLLWWRVWGRPRR